MGALNITPDLDVIVIGAGPSGLSAATKLARMGMQNILVVERELEAGGIPRHCGHPPFGMREFYRVHSGPRYANKLVRRAMDAGVNIMTGTSVIAIHPNGSLTASDDSGAFQLEAKRILLTTGVRETPRSARFISGMRPGSVMTTGALQSTVYLKNQRPFKNPVIVGTELVAFSALFTCRYAGIRPVAMIEDQHRITARKGSGLLPRLLGIPLRHNTTIKKIIGEHQVSGVELCSGNSDKDGSEQIACDGVIFTGQFVPEASLCRSGHLDIDALTAGPLVDQSGRCSDPAYFATGNLLRPVETAGWCWQEGKQVAAAIFNDLKQGEINRTSRRIIIDQNSTAQIKYVMPGCLSVEPGNTLATHSTTLQIRLNTAVKGTLELKQGSRKIASQAISSLPERRILMPIEIPTELDTSDQLSLSFKPA